ncbi:MAG: transketolase C-terminal domain-containing protein, partial [Candidatus Methanomethylicaceae archaeon]
CVNRAVSAPINIWNDQQDIMTVRDAGIILLFAETVQEACDLHIQAFKIAEEVLLPVMINLDGFILSHVYEALILPNEELVKEFIPPKILFNRVSPKLSYTIGVVGPPEYYYEMKYQTLDAVERSRNNINEVNREFEEIFGRKYGNIHKYMMDDAEYALITMGAVTGTAIMVANSLRKEGEKVGVISIRCFRPFPKEEIVKALSEVKSIGVLDRALTPGGIGHPLFTEIAATLYSSSKNIPLQSFVAGLGGRDISIDDFKLMFKIIKEAKLLGKTKPCIYIGLRE